MSRIGVRRKPDDCPRTRRDVLYHLWASGLYVDICKQGPTYTLRYTMFGEATGIRRIDTLTFKQWEVMARSLVSRNQRSVQ